MPKRNTAESAIVALSAGDIEAKELRANLMATIPAPIMDSAIPFSSVIRSHDLNVRDEASYTYKANAELYASLKEFGLQVRNPFMSFSRQTDGRLLTISGNLRGTMMQLIRDEESDTREKAGIPTTESNPLPFEVVHGLIWTGLSADQERALVADQQIGKGLNEFELAKAIGEFWATMPKMTDDKMSVYFGLDRNKVRRLRMRYSMPTVLDEYRKEKSKDGVPHVKVGNVQLDALYTAYLTDVDAGNAFRVEGPAFKRAWAIILADPSAFKSGVKAGPAGDPRKEVSKVVNQVAGAVAGFGDTLEIHAINAALLWAAGQPGPDGQPINLNEVQANLTAYVGGIVKAYEAAIEELAAVRGELAAAREELATMRAPDGESAVKVAKGK